MKEGIESNEKDTESNPKELILTAKEREMLRVERLRQSNILSREGAACYLRMVMSIKNERKRAIILFAMLRVPTFKAKLKFDINTKDVDFCKGAYNIWQALTLDTLGFFTDPFEELDLLSEQIEDFDEVVKNVGKIDGGGAAKIGAKGDLKETCDLALAYVNKLAKSLRDSAPSLITNATMEVIEKGGIKKSDFKVTKLNEVGSYKLNTSAAKIDDKPVNAIYYWQYAILVDDIKVWTDLDETLVANTIAKNMSTTVMTWYRGRRKTKKGGLSPWYYDENN